MKIALTLLALLTSGCAYNLKSGSNEYVILLRLTDTAEQATKLCDMGYPVAGCTQCSNDVCEVTTVKEWSCLHHELRHVFEGAWHGTTPTECMN